MKDLIRPHSYVHVDKHEIHFNETPVSHVSDTENQGSPLVVPKSQVQHLATSIVVMTFLAGPAVLIFRSPREPQCLYCPIGIS